MTPERYMILVFGLVALGIGTTFAIIRFGGMRGMESSGITLAVLLVLALALRFWRK